MNNPEKLLRKGNCRRILVAEDYEVNQKIAQLILKKAGYRVDIVADGRQAVEARRQNHYDLILMDIQMPVMDGHAAAREIRTWELKERAQRVPIIAMTGDAAAEAFESARFPEMNASIGKPLQRDHLLAVVQSWTATEASPGAPENAVNSGGSPNSFLDEERAPLAFDKAVEEFMGQKDILIGILKEFIGKAAEQIETIRQAAAGCEFKLIQSEAHALKGGAANLRADNLAQAASDLELAAGAKEPDPVLALAEKTEKELNRLAHYIRQHDI